MSTRWAALFLTTGILLAACDSPSPGVAGGARGFGALPTERGSPTSGGTVSFGVPVGDAPRYIFPITPAAQSTAYTINDFQHLMWRPLYWQTVSTAPVINYPLSLADAPRFSGGGETVIIHLRTGYRWSDGRPVDASDVIFSIDLTRAAVRESPANWGNYSPGSFPDNVATISAPSRYTVVLHLTQAYNPAWFLLDQLALIVPLPSTAWARDAPDGRPLDYTVPANAKKIYDFLNGQAGKTASYAASRLWQDVDGPFRLASFSPSSSAYSLVSNRAYTGPDRPRISRLDGVPQTSDAAAFLQLRAGALTLGMVPAADLATAGSLLGARYHVYGFPSFGWSYMPFNFKDRTGHWDSIIAQLYVRQALAHLVDQPGYIKAVYHGAADPAYGPVPSLPRSPFTPSDAVTGPYPYSVAAAIAGLRAHGWHTVAGGTDTCARPGTAPGRCGAGIPAGTRLAFNLVYNSGSPAITAEDTAFASAARQAGIQVTLQGASLDTIIAQDNDPSAPQNDNAWAMADFGGFGQPLYPTTNNIFNSSGSFNFGGYLSKTADRLIHASVYGGSSAAVRREASFLTRDLPALFLPDNDEVFAWRKNLTGPPQYFASLTQFSLNPETWYFAK